MARDQNHMAPESGTTPHAWYSTIDTVLLYHLHGAIPFAQNADSAGSTFHRL